MISNRDDIAQTRAVIEVEGEAIDGCSAFSYQSDVLAVGDPFSVTVPNPRGKYTSKFLPGSRVQLKLSNPRVNGGALTLKHTGRLIERQASSDRSGTRIQLGCADLGWHLATCCGPLTYNLQRGTFGDLFTAKGQVVRGQMQPGLFDPRWGLAGSYDGPGGTWKAQILTTNQATLQQRLGQRITLTKGQAAATNLTGVFQRVYAIQIEAGDKVFDILSEYARRFNLLVNVSSDGYVQVWNPDYTRKPLYRIEYHDDARRDRNNVENVRLIDNITGNYTEVTCVGEIVGLEFAQLDPNDPNAGRVYGTFSRPGNLPFTYRNTFCEGELWTSELAAKLAEWRYKRELFDSWTYEVQVKGHHQNGTWWESDTMVAVDDSVTGVQGNLYCSAVHYDSTPEGDVAHLTLKLPNLLSASFGPLPSPVSAQYNSKITAAIR